MVTQTGFSKNLFVKDLKTNDVVRSSFLVKSKELIQDKNGKPYLALLLGDKTGDIETRVWQDAEILAPSCGEGEVVFISGKTHTFQNRLQLVVDNLAKLPSEEVDLDHYLPSGPKDLEERYAKLVEIFGTLKNPWVRELSLSLLNDPEIASRYKVCPAAKSIHHAFLGGLLCHSLQLIQLAEVILPFYPEINRDRVLFGCAFHDFGKIFELSYGRNFSYTNEGRLVGHIAIGVILLDRKIQQIENFPKDLDSELKHLVLSHHGHLEFGSPKRPHTLEAELVHHLDMMDSRLQSIQTFIAGDKNTSQWTACHKAYDQYYYKTPSELH